MIADLSFRGKCGGRNVERGLAECNDISRAVVGYVNHAIDRNIGRAPIGLVVGCGADTQVGAGDQVAYGTFPRSLGRTVKSAGNKDTFEIRPANGLLCGLQRDAVQRGSKLRDGRGVEMLNVNIGVDLAAERVNLDVVCPQGSISKLIPSLQFSDVESSAGRCCGKTVAANLTIDSDTSQQGLAAYVLIVNPAR